MTNETHGPPSEEELNEWQLEEYPYNEYSIVLRLIEEVRRLRSFMKRSEMNCLHVHTSSDGTSYCDLGESAGRKMEELLAELHAARKYIQAFEKWKDCLSKSIFKDFPCTYEMLQTNHDWIKVKGKAL